MAIYDVNARGLNTAVSPLKFQTGECDIATNIDFNTRPGGIRKRQGSALWLDTDSATHVGIINAGIVTMTNGDVYVVIKRATTGAASLKYRKIYPTLDDGFTNMKPGAASLAGLTATDPGTILCHNGCMYFFNAAGNLWWAGGDASYNCGITKPTISATSLLNGEGQLLGVYLWGVTFWHSARNIECNMTGDFPVVNADNIGLLAHPDLGAAKTAVTHTIGVTPLAGDYYDYACLWRTLGNQVTVKVFASRTISQRPPTFYRVVAQGYITGSGSLVFVDGYADGDLDRNQMAPIQDNYPPPACRFAAVVNNRGVFLKTGGELQWSLPNRPEMVPIQNSWLGAGLLAWRHLTHGAENRQVATAFDGPVVAMGEAAGRLYAFTANSAYAIMGGEQMYAERLPATAGCPAANAVCAGAGGRLWIVSKQGVVVWPSGTNVSAARVPGIAKDAPASLTTAVVGYSQYDDAIMVAVPSSGSTKADVVYVFGQGNGTIAKWTPAWAGTATRGITKILSVNLPNAAPYVLFFCDDGKIYEYPSGFQDAAVNYAAQCRLYVGQEWAPRLKRMVDLRAAFGTVTAPVNITVAGLNHPSETPTQAATQATSAISSTMQSVLQGDRAGVILQVDLAVPAAAGACEIDGLYLQTEHEDDS